MTEQRILPPRLPAQQPGEYRWAAMGWTDDAHAFPPVDDGRLPMPAPCGVRWNVRLGYVGTGHCPTCVALLRDHLRAIAVALAAAGIRLDQVVGPVAEQDPELLAYAGDGSVIGRVTGWAEGAPIVEHCRPVDSRGDHFAYPDVIDPRDGGRNER